MKKSGGLEDAFKRQKEAGDLVGKMLAMEAEIRLMRGEFTELRHETEVELSRLNEFEDRMDFLELEAPEDEDEEDYSLKEGEAAEWTVTELMTGIAGERSVKKARQSVDSVTPRATADNELIKSL